MANISRDTFILNKMKHYVSVRLQQGVPLVDADWNEMEDIRRFELQAFLKWYIGDGVPAGNDGFRIKEIEHVDGAYDFTIQGGGGAREGAGRCLVEGWDVINESDRRYTAQPLYQQPTLAAHWEVKPLPILTAPADTRSDLVYLDVWEREVNEYEDPDLLNQSIGSKTCVRFKREWVVRVLENCELSKVPEKWGGGGNEQETLEVGHVYYPLARKRGREIEDLRRTGLSLSNVVNGWVWLPFLPKPQSTDPSSISPQQPPAEFHLLAFHARCGLGGATGIMDIPIPFGVNRINRFRIAGDQHEGDIRIILYRVDFSANSHTKLLNQTIDAAPASSFNVTWESTDFQNTSLDPEGSALAVVVTAEKEADIRILGVEFMG